MKFDQQASAIIESFQRSIDDRLQAAHDVSIAYSSHAELISRLYGQNQDTVWPNVTLPDFNERTNGILQSSLAVAYSPVLRDDDTKAQWTAYVEECKDRAQTSSVRHRRKLQSDGNGNKHDDDNLFSVGGNNQHDETDTDGTNDGDAGNDPTETSNLQLSASLNALCSSDRFKADGILDRSHWSYGTEGSQYGQETGLSTYPAIPAWQFRGTGTMTVESTILFEDDIRDVREQSINNVLQTKHVSVSDTIIRFKEGSSGGVNHGASARSIIHYPVFSTMNDTTMVVGLVSIELDWLSALRTALKAMTETRTDGLVVSLHSTCQPEHEGLHSFLVDNNDFVYTGHTLIKDKEGMPSIRERTDFESFRMILDRSRRSSSLPHSHQQSDGETTPSCLFSISIHPSDEWEEQNKNQDMPVMYAWTLPGVFLVIAIIFCLCQRCMEHQLKIIADKANKSSALVNSLFPPNVRDRMFDEQSQHQYPQPASTPTEPDSVPIGLSGINSATHQQQQQFQSNKRPTRRAQKRNSSFHSVSTTDRFKPPKMRLKTYLDSSGRTLSSSEDVDFDDHRSIGKEPKDHRCVSEAIEETVSSSEPIADFFPNTTVMFANIAGFTAWSSQREPHQVFQLLETIFRAFDRFANRLGVFKVETIGDCYVAVTGLPEPHQHHALIMARFAHECLVHMKELCKKLEVVLGPGTADLGLRVGLHSGPVTAGVLRGEKSRFQLFGDTMNTASRMESNSFPNTIQVSWVQAPKMN